MAYSSTAIIAKIIEESVPDLRLKNAAFLDWLSSNGRVMGGDHTDLYWNAIASGSTTATASMSTAGSDQTTGDAVQASLSVGAYKIYHQFTVQLVDVLNAQTAGIGKLKALLQQNIQGGIIAMRRQLNTYLWTGDGTAATGNVVGINQVLNDTLTYAGINPTTYPSWVPITSKAGAPRALTRQILYGFSQLLEEQEVYHTALFCTPSMATTYNTLFDNVAGVNAIMLAQGDNKTDLGFAMRAYNGVPLITDPQMSAGQLVGFNPNDLSLISLDLSGAGAGELNRLGMQNNLTSITSADVGGLKINVAMLPQSNPGSLSFQLFVLPQLKVYNRRSVQGILNLS